MKISSRVDGSIYGTILSSRPSLGPASRAARSTTIPDNGKRKLSTGLASIISPCHSSPKPATSARQLLGVEFSGSPYSTVTSQGSRRPLRSSYFRSNPARQRNWNHTGSPAKSSGVFGNFGSAAVTPATKTQEELVAFVDQYDDITVEEQLEFLRDPYMRRYAPPDEPKLIISDHAHQASYPLLDDVQRGDAAEQAIIERLRIAIITRWIRPHAVDLETIFDLYRALPDPRVTYLNAQLRHALLASLGNTQRKNPKSMLRYFAVVADVKKCGFALTRPEWNTAMSFASRYVGWTTDVEAEASLHLWREMEHDVGIKGNEVTFNILFDVASKAGKFSLAEMIYQEMNTRGFRFNRYHHVSLIHFFGLKMNASGVRAAYKAMVEAGEVIDSLVLNCVIAGLIRAGDETSAERVYEKMKASDERSKLIPHRDYTFDKMMTKTLMMFTRVGRLHPDMNPGFQGTVLMSPNLETYRILLNHFGVRQGQMSKVAQYVDEMKFFRVPLHGAIFLTIFKGFSIHGGPPGSDWNLQRLTSVWTAFLGAFDSGADGLHISTWMAMYVLTAFAKQFQSREQMLAIYDDLKDRWDLDAANSSFMLEFLHKLLLKNGLSVNTTPTSTFALGSGSQG